MSLYPLLGSVEWVAFDFAPEGWAKCDGQLMSVAEYSALYALIGTTYGGDGVTTFGLPDLRGRTPVGLGGSSNVAQGEMWGTETVTLIANQIPVHTHIRTVNVSDARATSSAVGVPGAVLGGGSRAYVDADLGNRSPDGAAYPAAGASQPHNNMQPYLTLNAIIAIEGIFPSRN